MTTRRSTDNTKALDAFMAAKVEIDLMLDDRAPGRGVGAPSFGKVRA